MLAIWLIFLTAAVLGLGFLLLGVLRSIQRLNWRLDQLEATSPRRIGRDGLPLGAMAPVFDLPDANGNRVTLADFRGRRQLLAFMQVGCEPCHEVVPDLNRLVSKDALAVIAVVHGSPEEVKAWSDDVNARFPVLVQENWDVSKRFEVFATPYAFVLDDDGAVLAKGLISSGEYLGFLLSDADSRNRQTKPAATAADRPREASAAMMHA